MSNQQHRATGSSSAWLRWNRRHSCTRPIRRAPLPHTCDVAVIGGGVMGLSVTYWLSRHGVDVLLLEKRGLCFGATSRNAGIMLPAANSLEDPRLMDELLEDEGIDAHYERFGHLAVTSSPRIWERICREAVEREADGRAVVVPLDAGRCEELLGLRFGNIDSPVIGGRWMPDGGLIDPVRLGYGLAEAARRRGAILGERSPVLHVHSTREHFTLHTPKGAVLASQVVFACNAHINHLLPAFQWVTRPVRGQVLATGRLPNLFRFGLAVDWGTVYWRQARSGAVVLGGYSSLDADAGNGLEEAQDPRTQRALSRFLQDMFLDIPPYDVVHRWAGIMDTVRDGRPLVGLIPHSSRVWAMAGFGGHGMPAAVGFGRVLAQSIVNGAPHSSLEPFAPSRFAELQRVVEDMERTAG